MKEWPSDGPPLAWEAKGLGGGYSGPSIAAGKVFGMGNRGKDEVVWALSEKDGKELWATRLGPAYQQSAPQGKEGPACTPTVDGDLLYVEGFGGEIACLRATDGQIVWHKSLTTDFGGRTPRWSYRESPLVDGDRVIFTPGGRDATLVALNKKTGEMVWKSQVPGGPPAAYASAVVVDCAGQRQYVQFTQKGLVGVAAADGKFLWRYDRPANGMGINITTPLSHDAEVFASSAYGTGGGLVKLTGDEKGGVKADEVYFTKNMQNHHGGMILLDGHLYGATGGNEGGRLCCLDFARRQSAVGPAQCAEGLGGVGRRPHLLSHRGRPGDPRRAEPEAVRRARPVQAARPQPGLRMAAPGHRQRQTLPPRPGRAALLRREGQVGGRGARDWGLVWRQL